MNQTESYILNAIKTWVWSGFYSPSDVDGMINDILDKDANESLLRAAVRPEFKKKAAAETSWPKTTDCDRLDGAFKTLNAQGIIALQNTGFEMSDGLPAVAEVLHQRGIYRVIGYCFYHGQDVESAVAGGGLMVAFGDLHDDLNRKAEIGQRVKVVLEQHGLIVKWNGDPQTRLDIPKLDWKRRFRG
ncbi:MAG TPA: hypothetical protein VE988_06675 [Gemmataceae bacterium]|nr:hypothetical protein [Gemmataceae bacterium]